MNIVKALKKVKNDLLDFIVINLQNKSDISHTHDEYAQVKYVDNDFPETGSTEVLYVNQNGGISIWNTNLNQYDIIADKANSNIDAFLTNDELELLTIMLEDTSIDCDPVIDGNYRMYTFNQGDSSVRYEWRVSVIIRGIDKRLVRRVEVGPRTKNNLGEIVCDYGEIEMTYSDLNHTANKTFSSESSSFSTNGFGVRLTYVTPYGETKVIEDGLSKVVM